MIGFILAFVAAVVSISVAAYPENTRHGYTSCRSCHISPTGGGTLSNYGRMTQEEFTTWTREDAGNLDYGLFLDYSEYFFVGGDVRYLAYGSTNPLLPYDKQMMMQADAELTWKLSNQVIFSGTYGFYHLPQEQISIFIPPEYKASNYYLLLQPRKSLTIRAGKFRPAFGLMISDHMEPIRRGIIESEAVEIGWLRKSWEMFATASQDSYKLRLSVFLGDSNIVGSSFDYTNKETYGNIFSFLSYKKKMYFMLEYNFYGVRDEGFSKLGYEVYPGIHTTTGISYDGEFIVFNNGIRWFPYPHFDLDFSAKTRNVYNGFDYSAIAHYYW